MLSVFVELKGFYNVMMRSANTLQYMLRYLDKPAAYIPYIGAMSHIPTIQMSEISSLNNILRKFENRTAFVRLAVLHYTRA
jgi:hypothetical protein